MAVARRNASIPPFDEQGGTVTQCKLPAEPGIPGAAPRGGGTVHRGQHRARTRATGEEIAERPLFNCVLPHVCLLTVPTGAADEIELRACRIVRQIDLQVDIAPVDIDVSRREACTGRLDTYRAALAWPGRSCNCRPPATPPVATRSETKSAPGRRGPHHREAGPSIPPQCCSRHRSARSGGDTAARAIPESGIAGGGTWVVQREAAQAIPAPHTHAITTSFQASGERASILFASRRDLILPNCSWLRRVEAALTLRPLVTFITISPLLLLGLTVVRRDA